MSITIKVDLPDSVVTRAKAQGLLDPQEVARLITREVNSKSSNFKELVREIRSLPGNPMSLEAIQAEVDAVRSKKRIE